jgi:hypothetical protein
MAAAGVELWLRKITGVPLPPRMPLSQPLKSPSLPGKKAQHVVAFPKDVIAKEVDGLFVLMNQTTQDVRQFNQEASHFLALMCQEVSWESVFALMHQRDEQTLNEQELQDFVADLQREGWIIQISHFPKRGTGS